MKILTLCLILCSSFLTAQKVKKIKPHKSKCIYEKTIVLPNGETVHKFYFERPKNCIDCMSGEVFITPEDTVVARRTIGYAIRIFVKEGYEREWFWKTK